MGSRVASLPPSIPEVKRHIRAIVESPSFTHSPRQTKLLEYLCNKVLLGESDQIKAATIAMEVFGRPWDFDETKDAVVRVEAHRLRKKLAKYYEEFGSGETIRIVIKAGGYVPEFVTPGSSHLDLNEHHSVEDELLDHAGDQDHMVLTEPTVLVHPDAPNHPAPVVSPAEQKDAPEPVLAPAATSGSRRILFLTLSAVAVACGVLWFLAQRSRTPAAPVRPAAFTPAAFPLTREVRILAGHANGTYTDRFGRTWGPDRFFNGGTVEPGPKDFYGRPPDAGLFATMRTGEFSYDIPVEPGSYELHLYWAEPIFRLANESNGGGENERRFSVSVNGKQILHAFDVVADSGIAAVDVRSFKDISPGRDGKVHIRFSANYGTPFLNGLELLPSPDGHALPIRIRAHELAFNDHAGVSWSPDNYFVGGRFATHKEPVVGAADPDLYAGERYGNFNYAIPVPNGRYSLTLHFAETWFRPESTGQDKGGKGTRIFDVYCNGTTLLKDFDILSVSAPFQPVVRTFHGVRPNGQGKLLISFSPVSNYATVKAIEIAEEP